MKPLGFPKRLRLCSTKEVEALFAQGASAKRYPLRVVAISLPPGSEPEPRVAVLFAVPRKRFKSAVTRNLLKRRMREAYRISCLPSIEIRSDCAIRWAFIYISDQVLPYSSIQRAMESIARSVLKGVIPAHSP